MTIFKPKKLEQLSIFEIFKIGVGPSSSHTLGPWQAALDVVRQLKSSEKLSEVGSIQVDLYGSLALTGGGHGTDFAILMGLLGFDPTAVPQEDIDGTLNRLNEEYSIYLGNDHSISFSVDRDITFWSDRALTGHPNGLEFHIINQEGQKTQTLTYYSIGGGFILQEGAEDQITHDIREHPYPIEKAKDLIKWHKRTGLSLDQIILANEEMYRKPIKIHRKLINIWNTMLECMYHGCHTEGILPGGLNLKRRASLLNRQIMTEKHYEGPLSWSREINKTQFNFPQTIRWINSFAIGVNEQNANFGRVVTAPTNGAAGVVPAVLMYATCLTELPYSENSIEQFLLVAGQIGILYKNGATLSAAMGGCQAEIGVSSSMAAAGLIHLMGGSPEQVCMAAEIAMEHHLGLTCDPVNGLVQIPCIERNSIGAMKAITASQLALDGNPSDSKVSLDQIIRTMWETALDMNHKYKETSQAGLATILNQPEC